MRFTNLSHAGHRCGSVSAPGGWCPQRCVYADTMCLSHTHMDHVGGAGFYIATRSLVGLPPPTVLLPASRAKAFETFIQSLRTLDGSDLHHVAVPILPGGQHAASRNLIVRPFPTVHPVPSQGYVVYSTKEKLRAEHAGKSGEEIRDLRRAGVCVTHTVEVPEVAFTVGVLHSACSSTILHGGFAPGSTRPPSFGPSRNVQEWIRMRHDACSVSFFLSTERPVTEQRVFIGL